MEEFLLALADDQTTINHRSDEWPQVLLQQFSDPTCPAPDAEQLARRQGCSVATIRRHFLTATGRSLVQAWNEARLELAAGFLAQSDDSIRDIAKACGYSDPLYFSRLFRRQFNIAPRAFRQQVRD